MRSTLKDIAQALNVSTTTVSWVLSGKGEQKGISKATEERVMKYAKELNYQPNLLARSLHYGTSHTIGLIVPSIGDLFYSSLARVIEQEAEKFGYALMICSSESDLGKENRMVDALRAKQVDGILMAPTKLSDEKIVSMLDDKYPFVLFDRYYPELPTNYVIIDNENSSQQLVSHLIRRGYRKIAIITTNTYLYTMDLRYRGYCNAYAAAGLTPDPGLYGVVEYGDHEVELERVLDRIFERVPDVDAFFFATHIFASRFFAYCADRGIGLDFGFAALHEEPLYSVLAPNFNVATMPIEGMGHEAVRILLQNIKNRSGKKKADAPKQGVILSCSLKYRD
ncbi:MAG: LacI family DNA-binding transcriptional regulator [Rikenellaceae bacterium]|nr:LacI family DNA-binding transcriptional regulator [Rikenellaceae bacterium]